MGYGLGFVFGIDGDGFTMSSALKEEPVSELPSVSIKRIVLSLTF